MPRHPAWVAFLAVLTCNPPAAAADAPAAPRTVDIRPIAHKAWGSSPERVQAILHAAAQELDRHFAAPLLKPILVEPLGGPITLFDRGPGGEYRVQLDTGDNLWAQWVYQFAHEFGHIRSSFDSVSHQNKWFEETICEVASLYVLRRLAVVWAEDGRPDAWKKFAPALRKYVEARVAKAQLAEDVNFPEWYAAHARELHRNGYDREKNTIIAVRLLPLFEKTPEHWEAIGLLAKAKKGHAETLPEFLKAWQAQCPEKHRAFVAAVAQSFGIDLAKVTLTPAKEIAK